ncbi:MAG: DUF4129 domain-containing protein [Jatrophihabitans sp.]
MVILPAVVVGPDPVGGSAAQKAAEAELKRGVYHHDEPSLLTRAANWIGDKLGALFTGGGGSHALLLLLMVVLGVVIVLAVRAGVPAHRARGAGEIELDPLAPIASLDHRRLAAQFAAEGRRAEALREWLRAAVRTIEERGVLPARPGRTGAATAREAGVVLPTAAVDLAAATTAFDEVWFGGRSATDADVAHGRTAAEHAASARIVRDASATAAPW